MKLFREPRFHFILSNTNKDGRRLIFINFSYGYYEIINSKKKYKTLKLSTKELINPKYWDNTRGNQKANPKYVRETGATLNINLKKIVTCLSDELTNFRTLNKKNPTPQELKALFNGEDNYEKKITYIVDYATKYITDRSRLPKSSDLYLSYRLKQQYEDLVKHLNDYQEMAKLTLSFENLSYGQYWGFFEEINNLKEQKSGTPYTINNISRICKNLRAVLNSAHENKISIGFNYKARGLKIKEVKASTSIYISLTNLNTIIQSTPETQQEKVAKNYIIIASLTGLRIENMETLHTIKPQIYEKGTESFFGFESPINKTDDLSVIFPILKPIKKILEENNDKFPKFPSKPKIRLNIKSFLKRLELNDKVIVTHQYYPDIKLIEEKELHEVIKPHDCKKTFVTNLKKLGIDNDLIAKFAHPKKGSNTMTGHYDNSDLIDNAIQLIDSLKDKDSDIYSM